MQYFKRKEIKNICLIGLMGAGKTLIGRELSKKLNFSFIDTDNEIEKYMGYKINEIFTKHGENYFRKIEEEICLKFLDNTNSVISLGGGSIINKNIRNILKKNSYSIYLKVKIDILIKRLQNSKKRPLLKNKDKKFELNKIYEKRKDFYNNADLIIENNFEKKEIINNILFNIKQL